MKLIVCKLISVLMLLFAYSHAANAGIAYATMGFSWPYAIGSGTTDSDYEMGGIHTGYATVTVRSPSGRSAVNAGNNIGSVTVYTYLNLSGESGYFTSTNEAREFCPVVGVSFSDGNPSQGTSIPPYVYVSSVSFSPTSMHVSNGTSTFTVTVGKSNTCTASSANIQANFSSANSQMSFTRPNPNYGDETFVNSIAQKSFTVTTSLDNHASGSIQGDGLVNSAGTCAFQGGVKNAVVLVQ